MSQGAQNQAKSTVQPNAFKRALYARGWTMRELAAHWDITPEYMRRVAGNPDRPRWFNDALKGLPRRGKPRTPRRAWEGGIDPNQQRKPRPPGLRYHGDLLVGSVVTVSKYLGEIADEDERGLVVQVLRQGQTESYRVIFERGGIDIFDPALVDEYLVDSCIYPRKALAGYQWRGEAAAAADFAAGLFQFAGSTDA
jgi:hypothetical protein